MADALRLEPDIRAQTGRDLKIAALAAGQHGVVSREQLLQIGISRRAVGHRLESGRLHVVHRGVYAVGHRVLTREGRGMAAALAARGVLSHRAAGAMWEIAPSSILEVTAPRPRRRPGIRIHCSQLPPDEVTRVRGIPVTTVPRTLFDLAAVLPRERLERALEEAEVRRLASALSIPDLLRRHPRRPGAPLLAAILGAGRGITRSELEARFFDLLEQTGFPLPQRNAHVHAGGRWFECDCVWRTPRLVVELDGRAFHETAGAFERDRVRDRVLQAAGWRVIRITWRQLRDEADVLVADLRALLATKPA